MTDPDPPPAIRDRQTRLAPYAVAASVSRGRAHPETPDPDGAPFDLDQRRILHCTAFRRLTDKTQVFATAGGDHFRTRLTHTVEVAAQARRLAQRLGLNERLAEAVALAHDLGHPPFGHAGEQALSALMAARGGFEHNRQSLRVVSYLEHPYPAFRGLNLTFEIRESLLKHHTPHDKPDLRTEEGDDLRPLIDAGPMPPLEGQVVNLADTIAYTLHDIEDALVECGLTEEALNGCRVWREAARTIRAKHPLPSVHAIRRPVLDRIATRLVEDATVESLRRIAAAGIQSPDNARGHKDELVSFSTEMAAGLQEMQELLVASVYRNPRVVEMDAEARRLIHGLFNAYLADPRQMPKRFAARVPTLGRRRVVCDYVAGMTDRFCRRQAQAVGKAGTKSKE